MTPVQVTQTFVFLWLCFTWDQSWRAGHRGFNDICGLFLILESSSSGVHGYNLYCLCSVGASQCINSAALGLRMVSILLYSYKAPRLWCRIQEGHHTHIITHLLSAPAPVSQVHCPSPGWAVVAWRCLAQAGRQEPVRPQCCQEKNTFSSKSARRYEYVMFLRISTLLEFL